MLKIAVVQMVSSSDLQKNLNQMEKYIALASRKKAALIVFPELCYFYGSFIETQNVTKKYKEILSFFCGLAKKYQIDLIPGSLRKPSLNRFYNCLSYISKKGNVVSSYDKIFLFRAYLSGKLYREEKLCKRGNKVRVAKRDWGNVGFSICYDLRFPELFRALKKRNAKIIVLPSAFTIPTGKAHWHTLIRARAIENQCFFVAPDIVGVRGDGSSCYGHSLVVNPWGEIKCDMKQKVGMEILDLDFSEIGKASYQVCAWKSRREDLFPIK